MSQNQNLSTEMELYNDALTSEGKTKLYYFPPLIIQLVVRPITRFLMKFFCRTRIIGLENLSDLPERFILASNHIHEFDALILPSVLPLSKLHSPVYFVSLPRKFYKNKGLRGRLFYGGFLFKLMGAYPAYKGTGDYAKALQHHLEILKQNHALYIFPEGKATENGKILPAHGGIAYLAEKTQAPILPVLIDGIFNMGILDFILRKRTFYVSIGELIFPKDIIDKNQDSSVRYKNGAERVLQEIKDLKLDAKIGKK